MWTLFLEILSWFWTWKIECKLCLAVGFHHFNEVVNEQDQMTKAAMGFVIFKTITMSQLRNCQNTSTWWIPQQWHSYETVYMTSFDGSSTSIKNVTEDMRVDKNTYGNRPLSTLGTIGWLLKENHWYIEPTDWTWERGNWGCMRGKTIPFASSSCYLAPPASPGSRGLQRRDASPQA